MSSPTTQQLSQSEVTTPRMSSLPHADAANRALTPPKNDNNGDGGGIERVFSFSSVHSPTMLDAKQQLEPPAWHAPSKEEIEYTDAWNNVYNNQSHFLCPLPAKDDSTIGSTQTNNSMYAHCGTRCQAEAEVFVREGFPYVQTAIALKFHHRHSQLIADILLCQDQPPDRSQGIVGTLHCLKTFFHHNLLHSIHCCPQQSSLLKRRRRLISNKPICNIHLLNMKVIVKQSPVNIS